MFKPLAAWSSMMVRQWVRRSALVIKFCLQERNFSLWEAITQGMTDVKMGTPDAYIKEAGHNVS